MSRTATTRVAIATAALAGALWGQDSGPDSRIEWRHIGNSAIELALPSLATGAVERVWYSGDGAILFARSVSGRTFQTTDFEQWRPVADPKLIPPVEDPTSAGLPEAGLKLRRQIDGRLYGVGRNVYRSDDAGLSWSNMTAYKGDCILGGGLADVAASPRDPDEVVVASAHGVWRSVDGGLAWTGINDFLPNLPSGRLMGLPNGTRGVLLATARSAEEIEWFPGEKTAWKPVDSSEARRELDLKRALSQVIKRSVTALAAAKDSIYAGDSEGRLQVSHDAGFSWGTAFKLGDSGPVEAIWVDANDPRVAVAAIGSQNSAAPGRAKPAYVLRTMNGGIFWDDITANLPENAAAHGVAADRATGAVYVATDAGVFYTLTDLASAGRPTSWIWLSEKLPAAISSDVKLDAGANQVFVALDGYGVYTAIAPHRLLDARLVSAADYSSRPAAPGALLSVLGARIESARTADMVVPVLDASARASQIQVPFGVKGNTVSLSLEAAAGHLTFGLPLQSVAPAIFVDPEGTPLIMDADTGILLDASKPAHSNTRIQILATGLGRVKPEWPTGLAAPLAGPPRVAATVGAYLEHAPLEVTQATLAPGYIGFYLIEIQLPKIVNSGAAELFIEAEAQPSNRVRLYIQP
jgi:uncharacterized protein (TIGR03437 family)